MPWRRIEFRETATGCCAMNSPLPVHPPLATLDDDAWEDLLYFIEERRVIPIIGPELLQVETDVGPRLLYEWVAEKLAAKLGVDTSQLPRPYTLNDVVCWFLSSRGRREEAYTRLRSIFRDANFAPPLALRQLAQITDFDLFVTTTFDPLLEQAVNLERFGTAQSTEVIAYAPNRVADLPSEREKLTRLFLRMAKRHRLSDPRDVGEVLADSHSVGDARLMNFLQQVSVRTRVYSGAGKFVDELHRRWMTRHKPGDVIALNVPQRFLLPERDMPYNAVFISYAREDLPAVQRLKAGLDAAGIRTWFDLDRLEGGDDYDRKIQRNIARCSYFIPVVSATTERRLEGYFRREWSYAIDRARNIAEGALFILPVTVDDTNGGDAQVPEKFKAVHFTRLAGGEVTPEFARHLQDLLSTRH